MSPAASSTLSRLFLDDHDTLVVHRDEHRHTKHVELEFGVRERCEGHIAVVLVERRWVLIGAHKHDLHGVRMLFVEVVVRLAQNGREHTARCASVSAKVHADERLVRKHLGGGLQSVFGQQLGAKELGRPRRIRHSILENVDFENGKHVMNGMAPP